MNWFIQLGYWVYIQHTLLTTCRLLDWLSLSSANNEYLLHTSAWKHPGRFFLRYTHEGMVFNIQSFIKESLPVLFYTVAIISKGTSCIFRVSPPTRHMCVHVSITYVIYLSWSIQQGYLGYWLSQFPERALLVILHQICEVFTHMRRQWRDLPEITPLEGKLSIWK